MKRHHPHPDMAIPISMAIYQQLSRASVRTVFAKEDWEIAEVAIQEWMVRNSPDAIGKNEHKGYQWKDVFLPSGTLLRTVLNGKNFHCTVDGESLSFNGQTTSPNGFVNLAGGMRRSAWKNIWVLLPNTSAWVRAQSLRPVPAAARVSA